MDKPQYTCYFCKQPAEYVNHSGEIFSTCQNHGLEVRQWRSGFPEKIIMRVSFAYNYSETRYVIVHYMNDRPHTSIHKDLISELTNVVRFDSIMDLTPENIERKLPTILAFM